MDRKEITNMLSKQLEYYINPRNDSRIYYSKEVTFNYGYEGECRIDYMKFEPKNNSVSGIEQGTFIAYEIKSSVSDFNSGHGCNWNIADKSYIVTLPEVYEEIKHLLPYWVGCIVPDGKSMRVIKNAKMHDRDKPTSYMLLMMYRSCNREIYKIKRNETK